MNVLTIRPFASSAAINWAATKTNCTQGCLFDLKADPNEHAELVSGSSGNATAAAAAKAKVHDLTAELAIELKVDSGLSEQANGSGAMNRRRARPPHFGAILEAQG